MPGLRPYSRGDAMTARKIIGVDRSPEFDTFTQASIRGDGLYVERILTAHPGTPAITKGRPIDDLERRVMGGARFWPKP